jgi:ABC-2 type transport system ATP-binding protein
MEEADILCDRVAIINDGHIAAIEKPANLKRAVGADIVRITLGQAITPAQLAALQKVFGAANLNVVDGHLDIKVRDGGKALMPALQVITKNGLAVAATKVITPSLEDVFLKYTGTRFEEAEKSAPEPKKKGPKFNRTPEPGPREVKA